VIKEREKVTNRFSSSIKLQETGGGGKFVGGDRKTKTTSANGLTTLPGGKKGEIAKEKYPRGLGDSGVSIDKLLGSVFVPTRTPELKSLDLKIRLTCG